jgi:hypothetical protein
MDKNSRQNKRKQMHLQNTFVKKTEEVVSEVTRPAWAGFKTAEVGIAIIMCNIW